MGSIMAKILRSIPVLILIGWLLAACGGGSGTPLSIAPITADPNDPAAVVKAFFTNRSAFDIDATMQYVAANIYFENAQTSITGSAQFRTFLQERADDTYQFVEDTPAQTSGNSVSFSFRVYQHGSELSEKATGEAVVENGKIVQLILE